MNLRRSRVAGVVLLVSVPLWWQGLHAWANSQYGYLEPDVTGPSPFAWVALILLVGGALLVGAVPRQYGRRGRFILLAAFVAAAGFLAVNNLIAGLDDGISGPGLALGLLSLAQAVVAVLGMTDEAESLSVSRSRNAGLGLG